jgi:hypothetical protein
LLLACAMVNCKVDGMFDETLYVTWCWMKSYVICYWIKIHVIWCCMETKDFFILMWCYSYYVSKCVKTDVTCCMCEIGRCIWVVCAKMGCCSSGLKSVLKIGDEIWLKNGWNWAAKMVLKEMPKWLKLD